MYLLREHARLTISNIFSSLLVNFYVVNCKFFHPARNFYVVNKKFIPACSLNRACLRNRYTRVGLLHRIANACKHSISTVSNANLRFRFNRISFLILFQSLQYLITVECHIHVLSKKFQDL